jgi:cytoskeletal protein CcmA (bactofilin family)
VIVFKRRKPEPPPAPPPARGHVIASGLAGPGETRLEPRPDVRGEHPRGDQPRGEQQRGIFDPPANAPSGKGGADLSLAIPAVPEPSTQQPSPVVPMPPQPKELLMSRPPMQPTPTSPATPMGGASQSMARAPMAPARMPAQGGERRTLVVGRGISVQGTITDAERLVVEGTVEASSLNAAELQIAQGGVLKGQVEVEDAEISGLMDGILTVKGSLVLRGSGQVIGEARCRRLQVEEGGQLSGKISMITDAAPAPHTPAEHDAAE